MDVIVPSNKKNVIMDATLLNGLACGAYFDMRYNHNFVQRSGRSNSLEAGQIAHVVMENYNKCIINGTKRSEAIGFGLAAGKQYIAGCIHCTDFEPTDSVKVPTCGHKPNQFIGVHNTPADSEGYVVGWKHVLETMEEYFDYYKSDFWIPLEAETVKRDIVYEDDNIRVMWKAKLDVIMDTNQAILPQDYKTMKQDRKSVDLNTQFLGQCFVMKTRSMVKGKIGFQKTLKAEQKFAREIITYTADRLLEWQSEIVPVYAYRLLEYSESGFWPRDYSRCEGKFGLCVFSDVCKVDRNMREQELNINFVVGPKWDVGNEDD